MKLAFIDKTFGERSQRVVDQANEIIAEYMRQGYRLTLRQLYYQFVSRDLIPNRVREYTRLGRIVNDARLAGMIDWDAIEDRGRNLQRRPTWDSPTEIIDACASQFRTDVWATQPVHVEVWIEKEALLGVIAPTCERLRVPYFACKGYVSQSEMFDAGYRRFRRVANDKDRIVVVHLGDHDPSGIDMTRDIGERLTMFANMHVAVERIALNWDQIDAYNPPPNPAKATDSRFEVYRDRFGDESWELDALEPNVLAGLITDAVNAYVDRGAWERAIETERRAREQLELVAKRWDRVVEFARNGGAS